MKMIKTIVLAGAMLMATMGAFASQPVSQDAQQNPGHGRRESIDDHVKMLASKLNLSDDQQAKVKSILSDQQQQMQAVRSDSSLSQDDKRSKMRGLHESSMSKIHEVLNDDQKKQFDEMQQQMRNHEKGGNAPQ